MICSLRDGAGSAILSSAEIGAEAGLLEGLVSQFGDLETALSDAQGERDLFFTDGAGSGHPSSAEIGAEAGLLEGLVSQFGDLETADDVPRASVICSSQMEQVQAIRAVQRSLLRWSFRGTCFSVW